MPPIEDNYNKGRKKEDNYNNKIKAKNSHTVIK